ncbi:claret isoform a [Anaeramoeba ignava]|uniref:Claret isoform a n=1 Tax=Anaeramoeba ignava TaxID=1746090 RepID=A0A9Q0LK67_ANAIG|nr:claret isoform a [Anaeramoeba ignava]
MLFLTVGFSNEAILTIEGNVFAKGYNMNPNNSNKFINISSLIEDTNDRIIEDIVSGSDSIYLLTSNQNAYGIGLNEYGQFGNTSSSVFLLNSNQELFGCGDNRYGKIIDIQFSNYHSIMLIENEDENPNPKRKLYSCGYFQFNGIDKNTYKFTEIKSSLFENDDNILDFSCGYDNTLILTSNSKMIGFGRNNYGELGTGDMKIQSIPIQIELPKLRFNENIFNYHLSCGSSIHFFIILLLLFPILKKI